jgi:hypothetical protein
MSQTPPKFPSDPARREALKAALLARHGQLYAARPVRAHPWLPRLAMASVLGLLLLASFAAPAEHEVEVGQRLTLVSEAGGELPDPMAFLPLLRQLVQAQAGQKVEMQVQLLRERGGPLTTQVEMWGAQLPPDTAERLRAGIPALRGAAISREPLRGRTRTRLGLLLAHRFFGLTDDPASIAAARAALQAEFAKRGEQGKVDLQLEKGEDGHRRIRATIESTKIETREQPAAP